MSADIDEAVGEEFAQLAWWSFIMWAAKDTDMRRDFTRETGIDLDRQRAPIERLVDNATGGGPLHEFVYWATVNHWGIDDAPEAYRAALASAARDRSGRK